jgi:hypothetical protein
MKFSDWVRKQSEAGHQNRVASLEQKAAIEEAKAGKSLRRSKPHVKEADRLRAKADRLSKDSDA